MPGVLGQPGIMPSSVKSVSMEHTTRQKTWIKSQQNFWKTFKNIHWLQMVSSSLLDFIHKREFLT